jgi:hypothetical protein
VTILVEYIETQPQADVANRQLRAAANMNRKVDALMRVVPERNGAVLLDDGMQNCLLAHIELLSAHYRAECEGLIA